MTEEAALATEQALLMSYELTMLDRVISGSSTRERLALYDAVTAIVTARTAEAHEAGRRDEAESREWHNKVVAQRDALSGQVGRVERLLRSDGNSAAPGWHAVVRHALADPRSRDAEATP
ncbi:hypothetical protein Back2_17700 [Nocardioides baekrokdamisoli]|uniref:Uncharacterized protein n=1 Tax=Nocardioides baekrokdamisoli TaxID=1804624 RepID=A0A3G9IYH5_9ACTN|nr:hypothetical protein [Nocardioides baekrokdamisoli]BBH17483.1 hypothetical protein Back2_17700 [Nocardioides baekrokdamisoli]